MRYARTDRPILALTYTDSGLAADTLRRLWRRLCASGASCAGILQYDKPALDPQCRCDMVLESLSTGRQLGISENRGRFSRGCRLDVGELMRALETERQSLQAKPDVLIVNKFGKTESEGGGFRALVADAIDLDVPVIIAVPWSNIDSWRVFAGEFSVERPADTQMPDQDEKVLSEIGLLLCGHEASSRQLSGSTVNEAR